MASSQTFPVTPPNSLKTLGWLNIAVGLLAMPANGVVVWMGIDKLQKLELSVGAVSPMWLTLAVYLGTGLVLVVAGIGLCQGARWGRWLSFVGAVLLPVSALVAGVGVNLAWDWAAAEYRGPRTEIGLVGGIPALWPGYGAVLMVVLNLPAIRNWAAGGGGNEGRKVSKLAITTLVLALTPFGAMTQLAALVTGLIALVKIHRSNGALTGAGLAWAGILFAALIFAGCIAWLVLSHGYTGTAFSSMYLTPIASLMAYPMIPFLMRQDRPSAA